MLIQQLIQYVLRGRREAIIMALLWTVIPFMNWLGVVIMALVTLRKGAKEGFLVLIWICLPGIVYALLGHPMILFYGVVCGSIVTWVLAVVLRETTSWRLTIETGSVIAAIGVLIVHGVVGDIQNYWSQLLLQYYQEAKATLVLNLSMSDVTRAVQWMSLVATGMQAAMLLLINLINLGIARWMQSLAFNPGGLTKEIYALRLSVVPVAVLLIVLLAIFGNVTIFWDLLPVVLLLFFVAGLCLVHAIASRSKVMWAWLLGFYGILILFFPYVATLLVGVALVDIFVNIRGRLNNKLA